MFCSGHTSATTWNSAKSRELHQMNVPDVKVESQNASIRNDENCPS